MGKDDNQEFLRKLDSLDRVGSRILYRIVIALYVLFTCGILVGTVYYGVRASQGNGDPEQLAVCGAMLLVLAAIPLCGKLVNQFFKYLGQKNNAFDPHTMALPEQGTVTLEGALHRMSTQTGAIVWDTILGCIAFSLLFTLALGIGNRPLVLLVCGCLMILILVGHTVFHLYWKKRSYTKKLLRNTAGAIALEHPEAYAKAVEESLKRGVLSYEKELILTDEYILGNAEWDIYFTPVAIPRSQITEFVFFYRRMVVGGRASRTLGILRCNANGKKLADLVLGQQQKAERIKRILRHYQLSWREEDITYV